MESGDGGDGEIEKEEDLEMGELLKDRFRLSVITIAESEAKKQSMEVSETVVACIADLAFKLTVGERCRDVCAACWPEICEYGRCYFICSSKCTFDDLVAELLS